MSLLAYFLIALGCAALAWVVFEAGRLRGVRQARRVVEQETDEVGLDIHRCRTCGVSGSWSKGTGGAVWSCDHCGRDPDAVPLLMPRGEAAPALHFTKEDPDAATLRHELKLSTGNSERFKPCDNFLQCSRCGWRTGHAPNCQD